jgi:hypothetical protein
MRIVGDWKIERKLEAGNWEEESQVRRVRGGINLCAQFCASSFLVPSNFVASDNMPKATIIALCPKAVSN